MKKHFLVAVLAGALLLSFALAATGTPAGEGMEVRLSAPISSWDEAIPLGDGLLGGLLWGGNGTLRLSLDRGDLWDERPAPGDPLREFTYAKMAALVARKDNAAIRDIADARMYLQPYPTKIPAGRLELDLAPGQRIGSFGLNMATATGWAGLAGGGAVEAFFDADGPVALLRVPGPGIRGLRLLAPESVGRLGYPEAVHASADGATWFTQATAAGNRFCVYAALRRGDGVDLIAATVAYSPRDGSDVVAAARRRADDALAAGYGALHAAHAAWWRSFWAVSSVTLPDPAVQEHYNLVQYLYGAGSRPGAPPLPLQGVWTADTRGLPPWKGDYHNDLNTQMTYLGYQTSGRFEEGRVFLDYMNGLLPVFRGFARDFYGVPGAAVPGVMTLAGRPLGGYAQYSLSPVNGAWVGQLFYLHWRMTADERFLRDVAYPWCSEVGQCLRGLLKPDAKGVLVLPLSSSPEAFGNDPRAWMTPDTNYDIACMRMLFLANEEMAAQLGDRSAAAAWGATAAALGPLHVGRTGALKLSADEDLDFSHRHLATMMGIYPFNLVNIEGTDRDRAVIGTTVREIARLGPSLWCGYTYSWMAALRARIGQPEAALWYLESYLHAFTLRNGFHANGDQTRSGFSKATYRPFTLEGNFLAGAAVHEMLLQSWDPHPGSGDWGPIRIFPATPWRWHEAAFSNLAAEGGCRVSARRENNGTTWFRVVAGRNGEVRIRDNFGGRSPRWSRPGAIKSGSDFVFTVSAGDAIEAELARPGALPPPPPGAFLDPVPKPPGNSGLP